MSYRTFTLIFALLAVAFTVSTVQHLQAGESWILSALAAVVMATCTVLAATDARRAKRAEADSEAGR